MRHSSLAVVGLSALLGLSAGASAAAAQNSAAASSTRSITPAQAKDHVGEMVTVEGSVSQVSTSGSGTVFLNFGGRYPSNVFNAVIFASAADSFPNAASWQGKMLRITGLVRMYRDKPEIVLEKPAQVQLQ